METIINNVLNFDSILSDRAFYSFVDSIEPAVFNDLVDKLIKDQKRICGKSIAFDFDDLGSLVCILGDDPENDFRPVRNVCGLELEDRQDYLNHHDYESLDDASAAFKVMLSKCVHFIADYFSAVGFKHDYANFIGHFERSLQGRTGHYVGWPVSRRFYSVMLDLIGFACILKNQDELYNEGIEDVPEYLIRSAFRCDGNYYAPALNNAIDIDADIYYGCYWD